MTLKSARVNAGLTQEEAAKELHISVSSLASYEKGKTFPDVPVIKRIEALYKVSYSNLFFSVKNTV